MRVDLVQMPIVWEDKAANLLYVEQLLQSSFQRPLAGESLIVLPEMFSTGFSMETSVTVDQPEEGASAAMRAWALEHQSFLIGGCVLETGGEFENLAQTFSPSGETTGSYAKLQPFNFAGEGLAHRAGDEVTVLDISGVKVCPLICYDLRFPEHFRTGVDKGAEVFVVIANWPERRESHWVKLLQARAIENLAYVVGVNRVGTDPELSYSGRSLVVDPQGEIVLDCKSMEGLFSCDLDISALREWRATFPALRDKR
ncbi:MAG: nitrilase-related carbon-nitrogen hydrolase [Verrucomicrobiota bacterium]